MVNDKYGKSCKPQDESSPEDISEFGTEVSFTERLEREHVWKHEVNTA